ncbi:hypothetical protein SG0102_16640 [Intestinibaculum porci]|uniref:Prepilin-type N-terminal cleavage/methylation domain-containing protein n=1 Tax=Intestinibaculum porci TaxID=2487118 RepID=A0A3G9J6S7_9FIRM|nr:prepilin-type N-terminal cleavage/methylation domain-containing protein [Intestinibaculum porci]BBH26730.1 hypothetical protein SG0102_16640 [Intestinibaculum porci]
MKKKGFTLIEVIVVIVILAILMAIAVPSVMSYMNSANKAKYYAASRSVTQKVNVELTKFYTGSSNVKNYNAAIKKAVNAYNKSVTGNTYVVGVQVNFIKSTNNSTKDPLPFTIVDFKENTQDNNYNAPNQAMAPERIQYLTLYFADHANDTISNYTCYTHIYPNKKIEYHSK